MSDHIVTLDIFHNILQYISQYRQRINDVLVHSQAFTREFEAVSDIFIKIDDSIDEEAIQYWGQLIKVQSIRVQFECHQIFCRKMCSRQEIGVCQLTSIPFDFRGIESIIRRIPGLHELINQSLKSKRKSIEIVPSESLATLSGLDSVRALSEITPVIQKKTRIFVTPVSQTTDRNISEAAKASAAVIQSSHIFSPNAFVEVNKVLDESFRRLSKGGVSSTSEDINSKESNKMVELCKDPTIRAVLDCVKNTRNRNLRRRYMTLLYHNFTPGNVNKYGYGLSPVASILEPTLKLYKLQYMHITEAIMHSDGGPCYQPLELMYFLSTLGELTNGLYVIAHYISEAGCGKSLLDAHFAWVMKFIDNSVLEGEGKQDIHGAQSVINCLNHSMRERILNTRVFGIEMPGTDNAIPSTLFVLEESEPVASDDGPLKHKRAYRARVYKYDSTNLIKSFIQLERQEIAGRGETTITSKRDLIREWNNLDNVPFPYGTSIGSKLTFSNDDVSERNVSAHTGMALSSDDKIIVKTKRIRHKNNINGKKSAAVAEKKLASKSIRSTLYCCEKPNCIRSFARKREFEKHMQKDSSFCYNGLSRFNPTLKKNLKGEVWRKQPTQMNRHDYIISLCRMGNSDMHSAHDPILEISAEDNLKVHQSEHTACDDSLPFKVDSPQFLSCLKGSGSRDTRTYLQLEAVFNAYETGVQDPSKKLTAYMFQKMMASMGTVKGENDFPNYKFMKANIHGFPTFSMSEVLNRHVIKSYFSYKRELLKKTLDNLQAKELTEDECGFVLYCRSINAKKINVNALASSITRTACGLGIDDNALVISPHANDAKLKFITTCVTYKQSSWENVYRDNFNRLLRKSNITKALNENIIMNR
jgi:hypothetical protein